MNIQINTCSVVNFKICIVKQYSHTGRINSTMYFCVNLVDTNLGREGNFNETEVFSIFYVQLINRYGE